MNGEQMEMFIGLLAGIERALNRTHKMLKYDELAEDEEMQEAIQALKVATEKVYHASYVLMAIEARKKGK